MGRVLLIARNVFRGILHRKILYLWIAAILLLILQAAPALLINFENEGLQTALRRRAVSGSLGTWSTLCIALAIFMGASAVGSEITTKTIISVFSRPIKRWEFLVGKWIGVQAFAFLSLAMGLIVGLALAALLEADLKYKVLGISIAQTAVAISLYSALAIAFSTVMGSGLAGAATVLIAFLPVFVNYMVESENSVTQTTGVLLDYVVPPGYTSHYDQTMDTRIPLDGFGAGRGRGNRRGSIPPLMAPQNSAPPIEYDVESATLLKNLGYAAVFFALGCLVFTRRELRLT